MKILFIIFLPIISIFANEGNIKNSIVKIYSVYSKPSFTQPWTSLISRGTGSGCIIDGNRILTNAHMVAHSTYLEVLKNGETKRYEAEVLSISNESDLALITVKDKSFFKNTKPLKIGSLPNLQTKIDVYGFPEGGETLSVTSGIISRIEHQRYVHSGARFLAIQIDAPINPGNSGGPAISDGKIVGLVMQGRRSSQNIGYIIPTTVIKHYLNDIKDGKLDGYPILGVSVQNMENPSMKELYKLKDKKVGVLVDEVIPNSPAQKYIKVSDVITQIDGYNIFTNSKVEFRDKEYTSFLYAIQQHQVGDSINVKILRDGKEMSFDFNLTKTYKDLALIKTAKFKDKLTYYICGGFVFVPASKEYRIPPKYYDMYPTKEKKELVLLSRVLPSTLTRGFNRVRDMIIEKVNGKNIKDFKDFVSKIENSENDFLVFEDYHHYKIVLKKDEIKKYRAMILDKYNIKSYKSDDL